MAHFRFQVDAEVVGCQWSGKEHEKILKNHRDNIFCIIRKATQMEQLSASGRSLLEHFNMIDDPRMYVRQKCMVVELKSVI